MLRLASDRFSHARHNLLLVGLAVFTFGGLSLAQLIRYFLGADAALGAGSVTVRDIRAQTRASYISDIETNRQRELAQAAVQPIYTPADAQVARRQLTIARESLDKIAATRGMTSTDATEKLRQLQNIPNLPLDGLTAKIILQATDQRWTLMDSQCTSLLDESLRSNIRTDNLDVVKARVPGLISLIFSSEEASAITSIVTTLLVPNTSFDTSATNAARRLARDAVRPVERTFEAGQTIIRSGEVLGPADVEALERLNLQRVQITWTDVLVVLATSAVSLLILSLAVLHSSGPTRVSLSRMFLSAFMLILALVLARWLLPGRQSGAFLAPLIAIGMVIGTWMGGLTGVTAGMLMGALTGMGVDRQIESASFYAIGAVVAVLALRRVERISDFVRAAIIALMAQLILLLTFELPAWQISRDTTTLALNIASALAGGVVSAAITPLILYVTGWAAGVTTPLLLIELARPTHPLLQRMISQAPGSYHHSLMVANLAEHAAERLGADSLLVRVGAYYHDIGKMTHPYFFAENQLDGKNVHDQLDPLTSSRVLHAHVTDGLGLAAKFKLPREVRAFIAEHHGTTRTGSSYARAVKANNNQAVDDSPFRYPGPRPQSRETALLMLADASEAIVRARRPSSPEQTDQIVRSLIAERIADHQLDLCDLSLRELELVRVSFVDTLRGMYHPRVEYPELPVTVIGENRLPAVIPAQTA